MTKWFLAESQMAAQVFNLRKRGFFRGPIAEKRGQAHKA
jgi:hypothetical protein